MISFERIRVGETIYQGQTDDIEVIRKLVNGLKNDDAVYFSKKGEFVASFYADDPPEITKGAWRNIERALFKIDFDKVLK